jgi:hypothetical protein
MKKLLAVWLLLPLLVLMTACSLGGSMTLGGMQIPMILIYAVVGFALWLKLKDRKKK